MKKKTRKPAPKAAARKRTPARTATRTASKARTPARPPKKAPKKAVRPPRDPIARGDLMADSVAATSVIDLVKYDERGLVPVVAQDVDGTVLMLAWANRAALDETLATGRGTYWSRSRQELWRKGDTSGHTQEVVRVAVDGFAAVGPLGEEDPARGQRSSGPADLVLFSIADVIQAHPRAVQA